ncbi:ABC transporter [Theileria orientalis strain Shintoku]|uniref:ABC transporter n=1 Tax=Theileria orientalis strain Shintoku TaxID=869250 RepID=J4D5J1_THEOR|nr:ABC transporter [Theileria orientalis strain Shintoku]BAM39000.1 ABC transporter [Theileria orientalis strain Shintoku]|eukprot:XP_009689301.1 ABC transporter [Theileria orientalis strain Shintoku]
MKQQPFSKLTESGDGPEAFFWESDVHDKSYYKGAKSRRFRYYDDSNALKYPFYHWVPRWIALYSKGYLEPYRFHPLPLSDQIQYWEPILSNHISEELVKLELLELSRSKSKKKKEKRPRKSVFVKAMFVAFWKRVLLGLLGIVVTNVLSMSISVLVERLLKILSDKSFTLVSTVLFLLAIILCQILDGLFVGNFNFYMSRFVLIVQSCPPVAAFRHGLSHRRNFANNINGSNALGVCNQVVHSCAPDSECSKNPLYCPARRHQTREMSPKMITIDFTDSYGISVLFSSLITIIEFLTNFVYGIFLMSTKIRVNIWVLYLVGVVFIFLMVVMEIIGCYAFGWILYIRDNKICRLSSILNSLPVIRKMFYDDIAANIITQARNNELSLFYIRMFLLYFNIALYSSCINVSFYVMQRYFVKSVNNVSLITEIDTSAFVTTFYIYMRIINSMFLIPISIKHIGTSFPSYKRLEKFYKDSSPNFYISDNKYTGSVKTSTNIVPITTQLPKDIVVYYKDASFTWVHTRNDLLNKNYEPLLKNVNFELKRGEIAIVTGSKGAGKSNFIKSMIGEMTLVGGSMAVVPLHTSMPIFYASEDIFLQQGTIRSNIVFGYKFDEHLYNTVLKAVELELDISTWDKGDLRVVSDNAHSLSGGQRVRVELARAIYAYLVFHKVNKEYNNSKCSFLMCLDASFQCLDPYVSKNVFNNLFNVKTGLLVKDDLSVVLTTSKQSLELCLKSSDVGQLHKVTICDIKNNEVELYSNLHDFAKNIKEDDADHADLKATTTDIYHTNGFTDDMLSTCSSGSNTRLGRTEETKSSYLKSFDSFSAHQKKGIEFDPHLVYMKPASAMFAISIMLIIVITIMDNVKLVLSTDLSDYITNNINQHKDGKFVDLSEIKKQSNLSLKTMALIVTIIIVLSLLFTLTLSMACITSSRKFHEYCINSIFKYSSSVIKVKNEINQVMTYILCDIIMLDDSLCHEFYLLVSSFILTVIHLVTLFYLIPISIPLVVTALLIISKIMFLNCIRSSKVIELCFLETTAQLNRNIENATTGPSIYRSFRKDLELLVNHAEHNDYKIRSNFAMFSMLTWLSISFNWIFSATTFVILVIPILLDRFTTTKLRVGYFGLALSLSMNVIKSFTKFTTIFSTVEVYMCTVDRFKYFIPPGANLTFGKSPNTHEEYLVNPGTKDVGGLDKKQLLRRRAIEFKAQNRKFYQVRRLFYHPRITIMDVHKYLTSNHFSVELKNVCVYTTPGLNPESMILKNITVTAHKSEIIGMVGRTGAGKTTLLSVIQNIIENRTGQVLLDGKDLNDIPKVVLRQIIGVLPQLPFVFKGWTVRRFLDPRRLFSDDEINQALNDCGLLEFVNELPGGKKLDSILVAEEPLLYYQKLKGAQRSPMEYKSMELTKPGEESDTLVPNSQLRTLSLARLVLYRHFYRVIVVDEPPEEDLTEEEGTRIDDLGVQIYDLLQKYFSHCTTFVTAHDLNVLKKCTYVWALHQGCLLRICKLSDIAQNESISKIIEESIKCSKLYSKM